SAYNACRSALSFEPAKERCAKLAQVSGENFCCEQHAAPGSPGVVSDNEYLNFLLFDPQQVFPDKTLRPEGLVQIDRAGLSVLRDGAADDEFLLTMEQLHSNGKQREFHGVARFQAGSIRHLGDERSLGVYDTPLPGKINHCDIIARHIPHGE